MAHLLLVHPERSRVSPRSRRERHGTNTRTQPHRSWALPSNKHTEAFASSVEKPLGSLSLSAGRHPGDDQWVVVVRRVMVEMGGLLLQVGAHQLVSLASGLPRSLQCSSAGFMVFRDLQGGYGQGKRKGSRMGDDCRAVRHLLTREMGNQGLASSDVFTLNPQPKALNFKPQGQLKSVHLSCRHSEKPSEHSNISENAQSLVATHRIQRLKERHSKGVPYTASSRKAFHPPSPPPKKKKP